MESNQPDHCPQCRSVLTGAIETSSAMVAGIQFVVMEETPDRNWITCDACNRTLCKKCCIMPDSGYCDRCFFEYKIKPFIP